MDDLSFEGVRDRIQILKGCHRGWSGKKAGERPDLCYSNRRHLIRENYGDKEGDQRGICTPAIPYRRSCRWYTVSGVTIYFGAPNKKEFQNIVKTLAERYRMEMPEEELLLEANKWELSHGGLSGRSAQQFIDYLLGK